MPFSLYAATIPSYRQILSAVAALLRKADSFAAEQGISSDDLVRQRLAEDMLPFGYQVKSAVAHSLGAIEGVRAGVFSPDRSPWPDTIADLGALVAEANAALEAIEPAEIDGFVGRPMRFTMGEMRMDFVAEEFLLSFSQPNFYFHATTAYDILRANGVPLGKRDFLGRPRTIAS
ncbi:DUF1993 domain-containing protein [Sphingomonas oligophenolica]|uniref:DUF1993 domain-containing protein n=1 Tax=Sphingomonas oligophenolica TaxID=301154 RepID=A0ABU9Y116_9SPHN